MLFGVIDPGKTGAIAWADVDFETRHISLIEFDDLPRGFQTDSKGKQHNRLDGVALGQIIASRTAFQEVLMGVEGQRNWGANENAGTKQSTIQLIDYGVILGCLESNMVPYTVIESRGWTSFIHLPRFTDEQKAKLEHKKWIIAQISKEFPQAVLCPPGCSAPERYGRGDAAAMLKYLVYKYYAKMLYNKEVEPRVTPRRNKTKAKRTKGSEISVSKPKTASNRGRSSSSNLSDDDQQNIKRLFT